MGVLEADMGPGTSSTRSTPLLPNSSATKAQWLMQGNRSHMINIVTLPSAQAYMVDVGFGSDGPIRPLPLLNALETGDAYPGVGAQQLRLIHDTIANTTNRNPSQKLWIFQRRHSPPTNGSPREGERLEALEKWFGVKLTGEERRGIEGTVTELKG
ncbi:hypothetical protein G7Y79_00075g099200 [Physcia stellaris]|nr:hypothetical protein G7Y79_00075g099200 [Physcia stellaris]